MDYCIQYNHHHFYEVITFNLPSLSQCIDQSNLNSCLKTKIEKKILHTLYSVMRQILTYGYTFHGKGKQVTLMMGISQMLGVVYYDILDRT